MTRGDGLGYDDAGGLVGTTDFDFEAVEAPELRTECDSGLEGLSEKELQYAIKGLRVLLQWVMKPGSRNGEGIKLRAIVVCWIFLEEFREVQLSELGRAFGKKKQSFGRQVDDFKRRFPMIRTAHMRALRSLRDGHGETKAGGKA